MVSQTTQIVPQRNLGKTGKETAYAKEINHRKRGGLRKCKKSGTKQDLHDAEDAEQHFVCNQYIKITAVDECKNTADNECDRKEKRQQGR